MTDDELAMVRNPERMASIKHGVEQAMRGEVTSHTAEELRSAYIEEYGTVPEGGEVTDPVKTWTTYKRADGELICNEYGWVGHLEYFEDDDDPTELIEEVWQLVSTRTFTVNEPVEGEK